jgi:chromosome segregation ATPase
MADPTAILPPAGTQYEVAAQRLAVVRTPAREEGRPNLSAVFEQLTDLQRRFAEQVGVMETDMQQAVSQLPDLKGKVNWLIASLYEQTSAAGSTQEKLEQVAAEVAELRDAAARLEGRMELDQRDFGSAVRTLTERIESVAARQEAMEQRAAAWSAPVVELSQELENVFEQIRAQQSGLAVLNDTVRTLCDAQNKWQGVMWQIFEVLVKSQLPANGEAKASL